MHNLFAKFNRYLIMESQTVTDFNDILNFIAINIY